MKRSILLGLTGSVATVLYEKLIKELQTIGDVNVILTPAAEHFVPIEFTGVRIFRDIHEWSWVRDGVIDDKWKKEDSVLHIQLRNESSALVIAPCSANTLAKISHGICDNLLTTVARAWDLNRPFIIAPAMNTHMWEHPVTREHLGKFVNFSSNNHVFMPQSKMLACKTQGMGAMGEISGIVEMLKEQLRWNFPLTKCSGIPSKNHPGSFLCKRKHHTHTGVDLYCDDGQIVRAVEDGTVVGIEHFTGPQDNSPWWNDTDCILIEGASGVVCYGEVSIPNFIKIGTKVSRGRYIANVKRVLKEGKERPDIMGHSTSMLHMELYPHGKYTAFRERGPEVDSWNILNDPTQLLIEAYGSPSILLT